MYNSNILFLLGAGSSIPLKIPGMVEMSKTFSSKRSKDKRIKPTINIMEKLGVKDDLEEWLQLVNSIINFDKTALSNFIKHCIAPSGNNKAKANFTNKCKSYTKDMIIFRNELFSHISQLCLKFDREIAEQIYGEIVPICANKDIPIFTTNYDSVLEYLASLKEIRVIDNFVANKRDRYFWDPELSSFNGDGLKLIKIHGSITWHVDPSGKIERINQPAPFNQEGKSLKQLMIFPTRFKDIYSQNFFPLYSSFTNSLAVAKNLFVIGHSLRDEYLLAAIREKLRDNDFRLIIIDPKFPASAELKIKDSKAVNERIIHMPYGIEKAYPLIIQILNFSKADDIFKHVVETAAVLKKNKKEKIKIKKCPLWAKKGEKIKVEVHIETLLADYELNCFVKINDKWKQIQFIDKKSPENIIGRINDTYFYKLALPKDIKDKSIILYFDLRDLQDNVITKHSKRIRIKKN